jgi:signal transduction histidine kinase
MRFGRRPDRAFREAPTPVERLLRRTGLNLFVVTLALIVALLAGVGMVTAGVALRNTDQIVDQSLNDASNKMLVALQPSEPPETPGPQPTTGEEPTTEASEDAGSSPEDGEGGGDGDDGEGIGTRATPTPEPTPAPTPSPTPTPTPEPTPAPTPSPTPTSTAATGGSTSTESDDRLPQSADTFFLILDPHGRLVDNPQRVALTGLPDLAAVNVALAGGKDWRTIDAGGLRVRLLTQPVRDANGAVTSVLQSGFVLKLHDEQNVQILLTILLASLIGLLGAALVTLVVTRRALAPVRSAAAAERRFVAAASHELRTPVAVIRASAEILQREELVQPEGRKLLEDVVAEADRLGRLVGDLLALASAEAGAISVQRRPIETRAFVEDFARRARNMAAERGVRIEVDQDSEDAPADRHLMVSADPDRMTQLLLIFVDNAIDHSPPGGVVRLLVGPVAEAGRPAVSIGVADQGPGIPPEERARIFEPFARLAGRPAQTGNTGLGLAIARILAARQDATLHVGDASGGGAVFSVTLPRRQPEEPPSPG